LIRKVLKSAIPVVPSVLAVDPDILDASTPAATKQLESLKRETETEAPPTAFVYKSVNLKVKVV
jgi:hypothetical protein